MTDTRGTFRLKNVRQNILNEEYVPIPAVWVKPPAADNAYIGGGTPADTKIDKITFATDGISNVSSANLNHGGGAEAGVFSSSSAGYFAAGNQGSPSTNSFDRRSYVRKLTYASETISNLSNPINHSPSGNGQGPRGGGGTMSATDGYVLGGAGTAGGNEQSWISKLSFTSETWSAPPNLPSAVYEQGDALGNLDAGYLAGGSPSIRTMVQKITYASDTTSRAPSSDLPAPSRYCAAAGNATAGFIMCRQGDSPAHSSIFKFTYASGTASVLPSNFGIALRQTSGTGNLTKGYVGGGYQSSGHDWSGVQKLTYETGTGSRNGSLTLGTARQVLAVSARDHGSSGEGTIERWFDGAPPTGNKMYCLGGTGPGSVHDTFNMTTETAASLSLPGMPSLEKGCSAQNTTHSYIHAGPGKQTKVRKITWSTDTGITLPGTTSRPAENKSGTGNETKGYFTQGGSSPGPCYSGSDRVTYASDTIERVPGADMVGGRPGKFGAQATGNQETGYFMGGGGEWPGFPNYSDTNKLTYATDTNANCPAQMPTGMSMYAGSSASSSTAAYASNYRNPSFHSKVFKLVFATDTVDTVGNTTVQRNGPAMGGNGTTMYMGGGSNFPNGDRSDFDKLVYATDTFSNLSDANLQSARYYITGSGQRGERIPFAEPPTATPTASTSLSGPQGIKNEGYLIQGNQGPTGITATASSSVSRLDYSTDTWDSSVFANSTLTRRRGGASSTTTNAYIGGGILSNVDSGPNGGDMDKLTYATSTMSRIPGSDAGRITTSRGLDGQPAAGNQNLGYWGGGYGAPGAGRSHVDKFVYSSETASSLPNWPWPQNNLGVAVAMQTHAYLGGGPSETGTNFVKITFANDTYSSKNGWTTTGSEKKYSGATSSPSKAYIVGGENMTRQMDVTTWANDTTSSSPSTFLASPGFSYAPGQGSNEAGYFTGGGNTGNNGTTTEKITYSSDTTAIVPSAYFSSSSPSGINSYSTGGPNMNGLGTNTPNVI